MSGPANDAFVAAAVEFAKVALGPNGARCAIETDEYRCALQDLEIAQRKAIREAIEGTRAPARVHAAPAPPAARSGFERYPVERLPSPLVPGSVGDRGPCLSDRELSSQLLYFATRMPETFTIVSELWERLRLLVKVDYEIGGAGQIEAKASGRDGLPSWRRVWPVRGHE